MQKFDHSRFTAFILKELEYVNEQKIENKREYFLWISSLIFTLVIFFTGAFNNGSLDKNVSNSLYLLYNSIPFIQTIGSTLQYTYFLFLSIGLICLIILIIFLSSKNKQKIEPVARYATLYLLVLSLSFIIHLILQIFMNREPPLGDYSTIQPFYQIGTSSINFWDRSFPNRNLTISGVVIIFPVLFGNRSSVFKWIMSILSALMVLIIGFIEIGLSKAWFTDVFCSIGIVLFVGWIIYWHILFIKDKENIDFHHKLTDQYYKAYDKLVKSKLSFDSGSVEECKALLKDARELLNGSISSIQNLSGNVDNYIQRNEYWKYNVGLLIKDIENGNLSNRRWIYIF
ncbi:MAG: hypothetical protein JW776_02670 [Candidatus Lokiarchaeota archaeon]|nr:hypothetical protein [Candidatus Lokiarchaeota archaeon]